MINIIKRKNMTSEGRKMGRPRSQIQKICKVQGCNRRHYAKDVCKRHYHQIRRAKLKQIKLKTENKKEAVSSIHSVV